MCQEHELAPVQSNLYKVSVLSACEIQRMCFLFTVSWMLKVTRGPGEDASTRTSGKSSTSPILELWTQLTAWDDT